MWSACKQLQSSDKSCRRCLNNIGNLAGARPSQLASMGGDHAKLVPRYHCKEFTVYRSVLNNEESSRDLWRKQPGDMSGKVHGFLEGELITIGTINNRELD